jgi:hypothetical protein
MLMTVATQANRGMPRPNAVVVLMFADQQAINDQFRPDELKDKSDQDGQNHSTFVWWGKNWKK